MRLLPRRIQIVTTLATFLFLLALPVAWTDQAPWHGIAPSLSHAGGSPDETLNPPPTPPRARGYSARWTPSQQPVTRVEAPRGFGIDQLRRGNWLLVLRLQLTSVLRS
jgi:hypothetical protein